MNGVPVVKSKLTIPQLPESIVISDRIRKLINTAFKRNTVVITAPPGYGKTTLMIALLNMYGQKNCRNCWYRMEQEDRDLTVFYAYLTQALFPIEEPHWEETRRILAGLADYQTHYRYINAIICQELWAYCNKHPGTKMFIAFDDFHNVKESFEITESISYFINNFPNNCVFLISSRQDVDHLTEKQKLERNIMEIGQNDLCFIEKDVEEFLTRNYHSNINQRLVQKITSSTEGWIAGVIMVCQALKDSNTVETSSALEKTWHKTRLFRYMASEVLKTVDSTLIQFFVKVAALQDFTPQEAEEIIDIDNTSDLISQCEKKGLFLQKIIQDNITYRFHSLFREALLKLQHEYMTCEEIKNLNLKAAAYYMEHGILARALEHYLLCSDMNSAVDLITKESMTLMASESIEQLRIWLNLLPPQVVLQNPNLLYIKSFTYQQGKNNKTIPLMEKALSKFEESDDKVMQIYSLLGLIHYNMFTNSINESLSYISKALYLMENINDVQISYISDVFMFCRLVYEEEFSGAMILSKVLWYREMDEYWRWSVLLHSCILGILSGSLYDAENSIHECFDNILSKRGEFFKGLSLTFYCTVMCLKNDTAAYKAVESELMAIGEKYEYNFMLGLAKRACAYRKYAMYELESSKDLLISSITHFELYGNKAMSLLNKLLSLLWFSHQKSPVELLSEAETIYQILSKMSPGFCIIEISQSIIGVIARECGEYKLALEYLLTSAAASERKGAKQVLCGTLIHLAKLYFDTDDYEKAEVFIKKAFNLASSNKYSMFWDIHLPTLTEISIHSVKSCIYEEYALYLLERYFKHETVTYILGNVQMLDNASIKGFCQRILTEVGTDSHIDFSHRVDICLFGRFIISVNGVAIPEEEWKTKKIKGILEYLVLNKGKPVTRELLMELFWPDSDKKSAAVSLRAALYELKKVLSKYGIKNDGDTSFIYERTGSLEIKSNRILYIDTDKFTLLYNEYRDRCRKGVDKKQLLTVLKEINSLYSGDLLAEELYADWVFADREAYKLLYLETTVALASLYIEEKETDLADKFLQKALSIDPYNEEVCLMLLKLYISVNQRSRAAKLYKNFESRLIKDLNISPDERFSDTMKQMIS